MTDSVVLIQLQKSPDAAFEKPLLKQLKEDEPSIVTFDLDNFSEESIRQYAIDLIGQSRKAVVMVQVLAPDTPYTGLVQFFNRLQQLRHPHLCVLQEGLLPPQLEKMMQVIGGQNYRLINSGEEARKEVLDFLHTP